jgi:flagellar hook-associated protein 2
MSIQSLGVGSGLALDDLVSQLLEAERTPKEERLNAQEEENEAEISALGQIKSKLTDFKDTLDEMRDDADINGREPTVSHPSEDDEIFTAEASSSALRGSYEIAVTQLASGSRYETDDGVYTDGSAAVLTDGLGDATMTFKVDGTGDSFSITVTQNMSLTELREAINDHDDNFGVNANIIDTGTAAGAKLVFTSEITGNGNDLKIINDGDRAELTSLSSTDSTETSSYLTPISSAQNAQATIDGIVVESESNEFENTIQNVSFDVSQVSPLAADGVTYLTSTLDIGYDKEGLKSKIQDFVDNYNGIMSEIATLTRYGESDLEEDGALAGDSLLRGISSGLATLISSTVSSSSIGNLFAMGVELNEDGELEISTSDFGIGSGTERLEDALEDSFDDIAKLFTDEDEGIAVRMYDYVNEYTSYSGLIALRENDAKSERDEISDDRESLELRMASYESILRAKYLNLDQTVASLNSTSSALLATLG